MITNVTAPDPRQNIVQGTSDRPHIILEIAFLMRFCVLKWADPSSLASIGDDLAYLQFRVYGLGCGDLPF